MRGGGGGGEWGKSQSASVVGCARKSAHGPRLRWCRRRRHTSCWHHPVRWADLMAEAGPMGPGPVSHGAGPMGSGSVSHGPGPVGPGGVSHGSGPVGSHIVSHGAGKPTQHRAAAALLADKEHRFARLARRHRVAVGTIWCELLDRLVRRRIPLALVTGTSSGEVHRIVPAPILRKFSVLVTGDQVRHGKPHPEPYRTACRALRREPRTVLVLENAPYGIRSAQRAGIGVVIGLATRLRPSMLAEADLIVRTPKAAAQLISHLAGSVPI